MMTSAALAGDWSSYRNERFGVLVDIPPGFVNESPAPKNGDGLTFRSADDSATLLVWGTNIQRSFKLDSREVVKSAIDDGWEISYKTSMDKQPKMNWLVFSGSKDDRIVYVRSLASCKGKQSVNFRIEYPKTELIEYEAIVKRLSNSLKAGQAAGC